MATSLRTIQALTVPRWGEHFSLSITVEQDGNVCLLPASVAFAAYDGRLH